MLEVEPTGVRGRKAAVTGRNCLGIGTKPCLLFHSERAEAGEILHASTAPASVV